MTEIHNLEELNELNRDLVFGDYIYFSTKKEIIKYIIKNIHLSTLDSDKSNDIIFEILNIKKYKLAEKHYKYKNYRGAWPEYKPEDFKAAERLIRAIYILLGEKDIVENLIISRFEILDIRKK